MPFLIQAEGLLAIFSAKSKMLTFVLSGLGSGVRGQMLAG